MTPAGPIAALLAAAAAWSIAHTQHALSDQLHRCNAREDVFVLPPPAHLRAMTLGYHAAVVDLLWSKLLVEYGIHHAEHRAFGDLESYIEGILALEPDYRNVFIYADTLIVYRPPRGTEKDARTVRNILERGVKARPGDGDVWLHYGDFLAFVAPSFLLSDEEIQRWRHDGGEALFRAVSLGTAPDRALSATTLLGKDAQRDVLIRQLRDAYAVTDAPDVREDIGRRLGALEASRERDGVERSLRVIDERWRADYPFLSRASYLLLGPEPDALLCTGLGAPDRAACARGWAQWLPTAAGGGVGGAGSGAGGGG
jgi:hypothetical protein